MKKKVNDALSLAAFRDACVDPDVTLRGGFNTTRFPAAKAANRNGVIFLMYELSWTRKGATTPERNQLVPIRLDAFTGRTILLGDFLAAPVGAQWLTARCTALGGPADACAKAISPAEGKPEMFIFDAALDPGVASPITVYLDNDMPAGKTASYNDTW